jgi:hypothetical protein
MSVRLKQLNYWTLPKTLGVLARLAGSFGELTLFDNEATGLVLDGTSWLWFRNFWVGSMKFRAMH